MREIKFRAWLKESKKMRTVNDLTFNKLDSEPVGVNDCGDSNCSTCVDWYEWNQVELMQYTGLKDKTHLKDIHVLNEFLLHQSQHFLHVLLHF